MTATDRQYLTNEYGSMLITIDSYEYKTLQGRVFDPALQQEKAFANVMQFLLLIEDLLDLDLDTCPQPYTALRRFWQASADKSSYFESGFKKAAPNISFGKLASFRIKVIFRQNASWQGTLSWIEQGEEQSFRSVLELLLLLDNALSR
jgi:hypothetical protein